MEVKLREAEAVKARENGREAVAVARKEADEARLRAKEEACRVAEEKEAQSRMRLKFVAKLCGEQQAYMGALSQGHERTVRARRLAVAGAARREGLKVWKGAAFLVANNCLSCESGGAEDAWWRVARGDVG